MAAGADVVIYPPLLVAAAAAARAKNVRHVSVQLTPVYRARNYGPTGDNFGPLLNGVQWSLASWLLRRATDPQLNTIVKEAGLAPWRNVLSEAATSTLLDLVAVSPLVAPRDPGRPARRAGSRGTGSSTTRASCPIPRSRMPSSRASGRWSWASAR